MSEETLLNQWQSRLKVHFEELAKQRAKEGSRIFALEHGLDEHELLEIQTLLLEHLKVNHASSRHWLLWAIYTAERGYNYDGDEYWHSFEAATPGWEDSYRSLVSHSFRKFQITYNGVEPTGTWAEHFSIIAWPITHAVLPKYLQRHLARAIYEMRYRLSGLKEQNAASIGRLLARSSNQSTRFEQFLQQEELAGRIVMALLNQNEAAQSLIYPATLKRIVSDLETVRNSRDWLQEARREVSTRFAGIGRGFGHSSGPSTDSNPTREGYRQEPWNLRPMLLLRHSAADKWSLLMDMPDFSGIADDPELHKFLKSTRCKLNGGNDTKPAGWLLSGRRKGALKAWPDIDKPLISFEKPNSFLEHFLDIDCRLSKGRVWLFRIGPDGLAQEIIGRIVRPGRNYVVVSPTPVHSECPYLTPCNIEFDGANAYSLAMPDAISNEDLAWLKPLEIQVARTVKVWPAGLTGRNWDGEGYSEWLTTESPCFGITHDYPVHEYRVRLNGGSEKVIYADRVGWPKFFKLSPLEEGRHTLRVTAVGEPSDDLPSSPEAEGFLSLQVRHPKGWVPGITSHDALIVTLDPPDAQLQNFSENEVQLSVFGPESRHVSFHVTLCKSDGKQIFSEQIADQVGLPIKPEQWREIFDKFVKKNSEYSWLYHEAFEGILEIKAEDIGSRTIRFNHDFSALRWVVRRDEKNQTIKLVDDTGVDDIQLGAYFVPFTNPATTEELSVNELQTGFGIPDPGGLLVVHRGQQKDCVVISNLVKGSGLAALGVRADFKKITQISFSNALHLYETWYGARLVGPLVQLRRNYIIHGIISAVYEKIAGPQWMKIENSFLSHPSEGGAAALQNNIEPKNGFGVALKSDFQQVDHDFSDIVNRYSMLAQTYQICDDQSVSEFALLLAKEPHKVREVYGSELNTAFKEISKYPAVFRGARMLVVLESAKNKNLLGDK